MRLGSASNAPNAQPNESTMQRLHWCTTAAGVDRRVAPAIAPGGALLVIDALDDGSPDGVLNLSLYALHLGLRTRTGSVHSADTIARWLARVGLSRVRSIAFPDGPGALGALLATA